MILQLTFSVKKILKKFWFKMRQVGGALILEACVLVKNLSCKTIGMLTWWIYSSCILGMDWISGFFQYLVFGRISILVSSRIPDIPPDIEKKFKRNQKKIFVKNYWKITNKFLWEKQYLVGYPVSGRGQGPDIWYPVIRLFCYPFHPYFILNLFDKCLKQCCGSGLLFFYGTGNGTGTWFCIFEITEPDPEPDSEPEPGTSRNKKKKDFHLRKTNQNKQRRFFSLIYTSCCIIWNVTMFNKSLWSLQIPIPIKVALTKIFQRKYFLWILRKDFITAFFLNKSANLIVKRILKITPYQIK